MYYCILRLMKNTIYNIFKIIHWTKNIGNGQTKTTAKQPKYKILIVGTLTLSIYVVNYIVKYYNRKNQNDEFSVQIIYETNTVYKAQI